MPFAHHSDQLGRPPSPSPSARLPALTAHIVLAAVLSALPAAVTAQVTPPATQPPLAPQVTPRDLRPDMAPQPAAVLPQQSVQSAPPPNADKLFVLLGELRLEDGYPEFAAAAENLMAARRGQRISIAQLYALGDAIETLYRDAGYPLVRVVIPPQTVADHQPVRMLLLDGFLERLNLDAVPARARRHASSVLAPLVGRRRLRDTELERALTLAGRAPGLSLRSALGPGDKAGGTVLVLQGEFDAMAVSVSADDRLSAALGPWQSTLQLRLNQPFGFGEQAYLYVSGGFPLGHAGRQGAPRRVGGGGLIVPLLSNGLSLNPEFTLSDTKPRPFIQELASRSELKRITLRLIYPAIVTRVQELNLTAVLDASTQSDTLPYFQFQQSSDRLRVARFSADWSGAFAGGQVRAGATFSQGSARFGARSNDEVFSSGVPLSRFGAGSSFSKAETSLSYERALPWGLQSRTSVRGQVPLRGVMPGAETFSMDGEDGLSAFTSGTLADDGGWVLRQEWLRPVLAGPLSLSPYLYGAGAHALTRVPGGQARDTSSSYGIGLRASRKNASISAEFGRGQLRSPGVINDARASQAFVKAQVQF